ncbi:hypothetical protein LTR62_002859 [Meristemomyces frigidus]|uniref:SGNH hydrolase-type esterase domain-containing protein n=1 Tax=Meristemomyces frigidus TaxID=1508187 RepID=A0AAN7TPA0_9PEZI|nr:hypothetical protein LTR62_002859 [Meristemomyces frigidus]
MALQPTALTPMEQFILFGDSITQQCFSPTQTFSFGAALGDAYIRRLDVVNRGLSGYNTTQALRALPFCIPKPEQAKVRFLALFWGANDARIAGSPGGPSQTVASEEFRRNLEAMVRHPCVTAHRNIRIILLTTPPIDERRNSKDDHDHYPGLGGTLRRTAMNTAAYAAAVRQVGRKLGVAVLDIHSAMLARAGHSLSDPNSTDDGTPLLGSMNAEANNTLQSYLHDGLHFSGEGYRVLFDEMMAFISQTWPDQMPTSLPMVFPAWDDETVWKQDEEWKEIKSKS